MTRRLVLQAVNARYQPYADAASPAVQSWCRRTGWEYELASIPDGVHPYTFRYSVIGDYLARIDYVFWLDIDIVPVRSDDIVYDLNADLSVSTDYNGICSGAVVYKSGRWAQWLVRTLHQQFPSRLEHRLQEQDFMAGLLRIPSLATRTYLLPEDQIANPRSLLGGRQPIFMHVWANAHFERCLEHVRKLSANFLVEYP